MSDTWIILGATSSMARAFTRAVASDGSSVILCGRDSEDMAATATDTKAMGATEVDVFIVDVRKPKTFVAPLKLAAERTGTINVAVFVGSMPEQADIDAKPQLLAGTITDSFTGPAEFLTRAAPIIEDRGAGTVVGIGSVAGDRGRLRNYVYGSAKAGFHTYLAGLRNRLSRSGGHVVTVKPGFVDTSMTWGLDGMFLVASPEDVARDILKAVRKKRNVIYTPFFWLFIMLIIRHIPEPIFKKLKI